jgi:predicted nucleic acid-binding protein
VTLVVDASVAAKWVLPEDGADKAAALRDADDDFIAPSLIVAEIGNAIWKRAIGHELSKADALQAHKIAVSLLARLVPLEQIGARATEIAIDLRHPIYDCFYLALAEREGCPHITADTRLIRAARRMKGIEVRPL